jgi:alkanesulfonate monooxygenase SsuD/methylene tetrahydromethanopterin reductase-like flavin-dependent oxidoreductase (luciferase family)
MFMMRFDMRAPASGAPARELYRTAIEMCEFAETRGCVMTVLCEHHMSPDGYIPTPMTLAAAIAARTTRLPIMTTLVLLPLYNPVRLAEEMCVLDIISAGRASFICGIGYREEEYRMLGVDWARRGAIMDENLSVLLRAKTGELFEHEGRQIQVTPGPLTPGGPKVGLGGGSAPAARRAGRHGLDLIAQREDPKLREAYLQAAEAAGVKPGAIMLPPKDVPSQIFVAEDVDAAWEEIGPYYMNDVLPYAEWNKGDTSTNNISNARTWQELRAENRSHQIFTVEQAIEWVRGGRPLGLHPIIGGMPPEMAWKYLRNVTDKVVPAVSGK